VLTEGTDRCRDPPQELVVAFLVGRLPREHGSSDDRLEDVASEDGECRCRVDIVFLDCLLFVE
jgi:hypothetical protein